ncbi:phage tail protein [Streptococcus porcinus]|uniref:Phage tail protein n=1 Tax=Streptococcus porcinus TaxID=1340 RepID=A0A7V9WT21_STRPO|nr:phage tail protein [Streptococcus porcinus]MBA2796556.1 phage tail protein [Streptococcus porcinus]
MAIELGQAYVQIMPSAKGISGSISKQLDPEASSAGASAGSLIGGNIVKTLAGIVAAAGIGKLIGDAIKSSISEGAALQQSLGGVETLFKENATIVKKYADEAYKTAGLSANAYMENVTGFSASLLQSLGGDTKKAANIANMAMIDMADNSNKMGTSMESIQYAYQGFAKQNYTMLDNLKLGYGGTKEEMKRLLQDAEKLTGKKYDMSNLSDVYQAIHEVQKEIGITGTTAREAEHTFSGSLNAMKSSASNLLGKLALGEDIKPSLEALGKTTYTFVVGNFIPMLKNVLAGIPVILGTVIKEGLQSVFGNSIASQMIKELTKVNEVINTFYDMAFGSLSKKDNSDLLESLGFSPKTSKEIVNIAEQIGTTINTFIGQIPSVINSVGGLIIPLIQKITSGFSKLDFSGIKSIVTSILPALTAGFKRFMTIASPAIEKVSSSFLGLWNAIQPLASVLSKALMPAFQVIGSFLGGILSGILTGVAGAFDLIKIAIEVLTPVIKLLVDGFLALEPAFSWIAEKIGFVIGLFSNLSTAGQGMGSMISSAWSNMQSAITTSSTIISGAINFTKTVFSNLGNTATIIKNMISSAFMVAGNVISSVSGAIRSAINFVINVFTNFGGTVSNVSRSVVDWVNNIKAAFNSVKNINLFEAGRAIIDSFLTGLKSGWDAVTGFVGGIAEWIKENKGPIEYDKKLLIPAGNAIMDSLHKGLKDNFATVKGTVSSMGEELQNAFGTPRLATDMPLNVQGQINSQLASAKLANQVANSPQPELSNFDLMQAIERIANRQIVVSAKFQEREFARMVAQPISDVQNQIRTSALRRRGELE